MQLKQFIECSFFVPRTGSKREQWVAQQLKNIPRGKKILDAGAGECQYAKYCRHLKYTSQDFNKYDGSGDTKGVQTGTRDVSNITIVSDIVDIPVKSGSFDAVLCIEVFEHIPRPLDALKELSRVLKKNGTLILTSPFGSITHYSPYYFYSGFSPEFYKVNLPLYGFTIRKHYRYGNYFEHIALELLRSPLIMWRINKIRSIPFIIAYILTLPVYALFMALARYFPESESYYHFTNCIVAEKTS